MRAASRSTRIIAASSLLHVLLVAALLVHGRVRGVAVRLPGTAHGANMVLTYLPGPAPSAAAHVAPRRALRPKPAALTAPALTQATPQNTAEAPHPNPGSGVDALGEGDISIALMQFSPDPTPDLSRLPHGSHGDVVLDAVIDASGRIAQLTVKQGLGYGVDEAVVAAVQQWTFHPAMRDGRPIASRQEFLFHYERG
jgi:protein TonB